MGKTNQARYTLEFKLEAVRLVGVGQSIAAVAPNLIQRDFSPTLPNRVWTTDITYLDTSEGWLYLTVMLDLFNRQVVGWSIQPRRRSS
jgi:transposase InsO family protein